MPKKSIGVPLEKTIRVSDSTILDLKLLKRQWWGPNTDKGQGHVVSWLIKMYKEKKIGTPAFLEKSQSPSLNPRLNEGAIENDEEIYKNLYEDSIKSNANFVKRVERLCKMLGISYQEGMKLEPDAPVQRQ